ncbi:hypothetical protein HYU40_00300 [Candidatus Woesearchaeota archaeon]|nr:hypothetical protein [Candidatus Woesearchaeota archaeon]
MAEIFEVRSANVVPREARRLSRDARIVARVKPYEPRWQESDPWPRNTGIENLASYEEGLYLIPQRSHRIIDFDIERITTWRKPSEQPSSLYAIMIDGYDFLFDYKEKLRPSFKDFRTNAKALGGFKVSTRDGPESFNGPRNPTEYINEGRNVFVNWHKSDDRERLCVGVIQARRIPQLEVVVNDIIPYAVEVFNKLGMRWKIGKEAVERNVELALQGDKQRPYQ